MQFPVFFLILGLTDVTFSPFFHSYDTWVTDVNIDYELDASPPPDVWEVSLIAVVSPMTKSSLTITTSVILLLVGFHCCCHLQQCLFAAGPG